MADFQSLGPAGGGDGLECSHCEGGAIWPDEDDASFDMDADACTTCGFPGHVEVVGDMDGSFPRWVPAEHGTCDRDDCQACGMYRGESFGGNR
jgi:hypothetical protein